MKKLLLASVGISALVVAQSGYAADLRPMLKAPPMAAPVFSWTGCFVGGQVGWGWQRNKVSQRAQHTVTNTVFLSSSTGNVDTHGPVFGGQVGCDYQVSNMFVVGAQGTFLASDINGIGQDPHNGAIDIPTGTGFGTTYSAGSIGVRTNWIGSATGRLGFTGWSPQSMIYVRGGAAWAQMQYDLRNAAANANPGGTPPTGYFLGSSSALFDSTHSGWTIGGGVEWMFTTSWSAFAEYNYYRFKSFNLTVDQGSGFINTLASDPSISTFTVGLNYRLNMFGMH